MTDSNIRSFDQARASVKESTDRLRQSVGERVSEARAWADSESATAARERVDEAVDQLREGYAHVQGEVEGVVDDLTDYVRHNPGQSVLIAAGLGFLFGLLLRRRD